MTDENKALIGQQCFVKFDGEQRLGTIVDVLESVMNTEIILYDVELADGTLVGRSKVEFKSYPNEKETHE